MGFLSKLFGSDNNCPKPEAKATPIEVTEDIEVHTGILDRTNDIFDFFIAGLSHHCNRRDIGIHAIATVPEPSNPYDRKAMAVYNQNSKEQFGYVPSAILADYRKWCKREACVGIGYVFYDGEHLRGRVRSYIKGCDPDIMLKDMQEYANQVCPHFGWQTPQLYI